MIASSYIFVLMIFWMLIVPLKVTSWNAKPWNIPTKSMKPIQSASSICLDTKIGGQYAKNSSISVQYPKAENLSPVWWALV